MTPATAIDVQNKQLAEQLYDTLMSEIEPDLLLANLPTLDAKYAGESAADRAERMKRYDAAYAKFDKEFATFMAEVQEEVRVSKRTALKQKEEQDKLSDQPVLDSLEAALR